MTSPVAGFDEVSNVSIQINRVARGGPEPGVAVRRGAAHGVEQTRGVEGDGKADGGVVWQDGVKYEEEDKEEDGL